MTGKYKLLIAKCFILVWTSVAWADCSNFGSSGVVPNLNDDGTIRSVSIFGQSRFLVAYGSLVDKALVEADLRAKNAFRAWLKTKGEAETKISNLIEESATVDTAENLDGVAEINSQTIENMRENTEGVISGLVKLGECVDPDQKKAMVELGWKQEMLEAAANTASAIAESIQNSQTNEVTETTLQSEAAENQDNSISKNSSQTTKIKPVQGYRIKSPLKDNF